MTVQPLGRLYAAAHDKGSLPSDASIKAARAQVDYRGLEVTAARLRLHGEIQSVTLNGIAQDPATGRSRVTVVAPAAADADALSTAIFVLGFVKGLRLIQAWPRADALFVLKDGRVFSTKGFPRTEAHA